MPLAPLTEKFDQGVRLKKRKKSGKWYLCTPPPRGKVEDVRLAVTVFLGLPPTAEVTHEQAREAARRMAGERARGITITVAQTKITVAEVIALYQKELERVEHRSAKTINVALRWVDKRIGGWRLLQLTTLELFQLASEWQREPAPRSRQKNKRLASSTVGFRCGWLCRALKHAEKLGVIGKHQIPTMPTFPRRPVRQGFLEPEEFFGRLGAEATGVLAQYQSRTLFPQEKGKRHYADATEWAYGCGWRSKEIRALEWAWVMANEIKLPAWICKNNEARTVELIADLVPIIARRRLCRAYVDRAGVTHQSKYVFHQGNGQPLQTKSLLTFFRKAVKAAPAVRAEVKHFYFHDLRRCAVRNLIRSGVDRKTAMSISGHHDERMFDNYNIQSGEDQVIALEAVSDYTQGRRRHGEAYRLMRLRPTGQRTGQQPLRVVQEGEL